MTMTTSTAVKEFTRRDGSAVDAARDAVTTAMLTDDPLAGDGVYACLTAVPGIRWVPQDQLRNARVIVVITSTLTANLLDRMRQAHEGATQPRQCMVLICEPPAERYLTLAFRYGAVSLIPRATATRDSIVAAVLASGNGSAVLPGPVARWLADSRREFEVIARETHGVTAGGLTQREVDVVRLLAGGMSTDEIARQLNYGERTIKSIIRGMLSRHKLRNRAHAVAYAYRVGVI
jgi:DNA-binding NarL/FixJ family response regulator